MCVCVFVFFKKLMILMNFSKIDDFIDLQKSLSLSLLDFEFRFEFSKFQIRKRVNFSSRVCYTCVSKMWDFLHHYRRFIYFLNPSYKIIIGLLHRRVEGRQERSTLCFHILDNPFASRRHKFHLFCCSRGINRIVSNTLTNLQLPSSTCRGSSSEECFCASSYNFGLRQVKASASVHKYFETFAHGCCSYELRVSIPFIFT